MNGVLQPIELFSDKWSWLFESPIELIVHLAEFRNRRCKKFLVQSKKHPLFKRRLVFRLIYSERTIAALNLAGKIYRELGDLAT